MSQDIRPLFILSLPRSGSTLLQRILASDPKISATAEPWVLLPMLSSLRREGIYTDYHHYWGSRAIHDFCQELPEGMNDYMASLREFVLDLYRKASKPETVYFLDKTPPYSLVANQLLRVFPRAKVIFLWRNPIAVVASLIKSFCGNKWTIYGFKPELFTGLEQLTSAYMDHTSRVLSLRYEDLISDPEQQCRRIYDYLELPFDPATSSGFNKVNFKGKMGDPCGGREYKSLNHEPLEKWKQTLHSPIRVAWCRNYLRWIGDERLAAMGYDLTELDQALSQVSCQMWQVSRDTWHMLHGIYACLFEPRLLAKKFQNLSNWHRVYEHY